MSKDRFKMMMEDQDRAKFKAKHSLLMKNLSSLSFDPNEVDFAAAGFELAGKLLRIHVKQRKRYRAEYINHILDSANYIVENHKTEKKNTREYLAHMAVLYTAAVNTRKHPVFKVLGISLLALVGAAILAATGVIAAVSFGLCPPLGIVFGIVIGYSVAAGAAASAVGGVLGIGALMASGMMMFKTLAKPSLSSRIHELRTLAAAVDARRPERNAFEMV